MSKRERVVAGKRFVGFDGLRGVLALCVIVVHVTAQFNPTVLSVLHVEILGQAIVVFFVLSGFLIFWPFASSILDSRDLPSVRRYAWGRTFRVFPAYIVAFLLANFLLAAVFLENAMSVLVKRQDTGTGRILDPLRIVPHLLLINNYMPGELQTGINSSWTLTVELAFYFLLPLIVIGAVAVCRRIRSLSPAAVVVLPAVLLILIGVTSRIVSLVWYQSSDLALLDSEWGATWQAVFNRSFLVWADNFGWGMLAAVVVMLARRGQLTSVAGMRLRTFAWVVLGVALAASMAVFLLAPHFIGMVFAVFSAAVVVLIVLPVGNQYVWKPSVWIDNRVFFWLGTISLSLYLWHYPVMIVVMRLGWMGADDWLGWLWNIALVAVIGVAIASASYLWVELPAMRFRSRSKADAASAPAPRAQAASSPSDARSDAARPEPHLARIDQA